MVNQTRVRAAFAAVLAVLYPGLGHVYLREWLRALMWFGLALMTAAMVVPESTVTALETNGLAALADASAELPLDALIALAGVRLLNAVDAAWIGLQTKPIRGPEGPTCPHCGKDIDPDLEFCHWCTRAIDRPGRG